MGDCTHRGHGRTPCRARLGRWLPGIGIRSRGHKVRKSANGGGRLESGPHFQRDWRRRIKRKIFLRLGQLNRSMRMCRSFYT